MRKLLKLFLLFYVISIVVDAIWILAQGTYINNMDYMFYFKPALLSGVLAVLFHYGNLMNWRRKK